MEVFEIFQELYAQRALMASALTGITCGLLGCFILLRNMSMIGDALSHAVLPGIVVGFMIAGYSLFAFFLGSVLAGFITTLLITLVQRNVYSKPDAVIGIVFTAMFALGVMLISWLSRERGVHIDMQDFLFGNVLAISNDDLLLTGLIGLFVILCLVAFYRFFLLTTFEPNMATIQGISTRTMHYFLMLLLSFVVVASLQSVGVILVVSMLIIPASTAYLLTDKLKLMLFLSAVFGLVATVGGLFVAVVVNTTPGPAMTLLSALLYALVALFSPRRGLLKKAFMGKAV